MLILTRGLWQMTEITINTADLLSVQDFAKAAGYHRYQIYRWVKSGKIAAVKLGGILFIPADQVSKVKAKADPMKAENDHRVAE